MKKYLLIFFFLYSGSECFAYNMIDDFQGYANDIELQSVWFFLPGGWTDASLQTSDGADGTTGSMKLTDYGYSNGVLATDIFTPSKAQGYKIRFKYMNGQNNDPWTDLRFQVIQNDRSLEMRADLGGSIVNTWNQGETNISWLTTDPISILIYNKTSLSSKTHVCAFDQIELVQDDGGLSISTIPKDTWYLSRTETIKAIPDAGKRPYSKVEFDVHNDGSIEFTDTTEPWEFVWDTTTAVPIGTSGTVSLRAVVTDITPVSAEITREYFIDNRGFGRKSLILNGDFSSWTNGVPDHWTIYEAGSGAVYPGPSYDSTAAPSLHIKYIGNPEPYRYYFRSVAWGGYYEDIQTKLWGRHPYCRVYYFTSSDGGATWSHTYRGVYVNNLFWVYVEGPVENGLAGSSDLVALCTHAFSPGDFYWDDIVVKGINPYKIKGLFWDLY